MRRYVTDVQFREEDGEVVADCPIFHIQVRSSLGFHEAKTALKSAIAERSQEREAGGESIHPSSAILSADPDRIVGELVVHF